MKNTIQKAIPLELLVSKPSGNYQYDLLGRQPLKKDVVFTPEYIAKEIIQRFKPKGKILDPCRGEGAFYNNLPEPKDWCELTDGRDFYEYNEKVDWIISNPPYTKFSNWLLHSLKIAENIVYLLPVQKPFYAYSTLQELYAWGGIKEIWVIGTGRMLNFPFGVAVSAIYFKQGWRGATKITFRQARSCQLLINPNYE